MRLLKIVSLGLLLLGGGTALAAQQRSAADQRIIKRHGGKAMWKGGEQVVKVGRERILIGSISREFDPESREVKTVTVDGRILASVEGGSSHFVQQFKAEPKRKAIAMAVKKALGAEHVYFSNYSSRISHEHTY